MDAETVAQLTLTVGAEDAGSRLDRFLAEPLGSRARAQALIDAKRVRVDGRARAKRHVLGTGEVVEVDGRFEPGENGLFGPGENSLARIRGAQANAAPDAPQAADVPFAVAYEDDHLVVVDKPAGVVVHPARGHRSGTLAQALEGRAAGGEEPWRAGIVHRLDRFTSGLLVVAKSDVVHRELKALLASRVLRREYLALVDGLPEARTGTIEAPIGRDRRDRVLMSIDSDEPREARTHFSLVRALPSSSLLEIVLDTGRTHQIRVHMAAIGHPVCGDVQYGGADRFGLQRQFLHAARLSFPHPVTGERLEVVSELPEDLADALRRAELE